MPHAVSGQDQRRADAECGDDGGQVVGELVHGGGTRGRCIGLAVAAVVVVDHAHAVAPAADQVAPLAIPAFPGQAEAVLQDDGYFGVCRLVVAHGQCGAVCGNNVPMLG